MSAYPPPSLPTPAAAARCAAASDAPAPFDVHCPHRVLLDQITDRWSVLVLTALDAGPLRFNAIKRRLGGVTQKALTGSLRRLERNGLVARRVVPASPVAVEYRITPLGRSAQAPIRAMYGWTVEHLAHVEQARQAFDERAGAPDAAPSADPDR